MAGGRICATHRRGRNHERLNGNDDVRSGARAHHDQARTWLVTGVAGFIGSNLLETLLKLNQRDRAGQFFLGEGGQPDAGEGRRRLFEMIRSLLEPRFPRLRGVRPVHRALRTGDVRLSQADIGKARRLLGYQSAWRIRQGLKRTIDWYVEMYYSSQRSIDAGVSRPRAARS